jgi:hypothetical protein
LNPTRTFSVVVSDGKESSADGVCEAMIQVQAVNDAPVLSNGGGNAMGVVYAGIDTMKVAPNVTIKDIDDLVMSKAEVKIEFGYVNSGFGDAAITDEKTRDTLSFIAEDGGINGDFDMATGVLTLTGEASIDSYTQALRSVSFHPAVQSTDGLFDSRTFELAVYDKSMAASTSSPTIEASLQGALQPCAPHVLPLTLQHYYPLY